MVAVVLVVCTHHLKKNNAECINIILVHVEYHNNIKTTTLHIVNSQKCAPTNRCYNFPSDNNNTNHKINLT